jgi:lysyl-tRNA synthetase class I
MTNKTMAKHNNVFASVEMIELDFYARLQQNHNYEITLVCYERVYNTSGHEILQAIVQSHSTHQDKQEANEWYNHQVERATQWLRERIKWETTAPTVLKGLNDD